MIAGVDADRRLLRLLAVAAGVSYIAATALGVAMRFQYVGLSVPIPFDHLLHAHSHTLYFGWAGLAILSGAISVAEQRHRSMKAAAAVLLASPPALLLGFAALGYHPMTIALSTGVMLVWYTVIVAWWFSVRALRTTGHTALRAAMGYLVVASGGVWVMAGLQATGRGGALAESLAVHAFVGGFGWFMVLGVVGLLATNADRLNIHFEESVLRSVIRWWVPLAWLTFPLSVAGGPETPILGPVSRLAGLALLVPAWLWVRTLWNASPGRAATLWRMAAAWFALSSLTLASVAVLGSQALIAGGRQAVVVHLHALLVGFVTGSLAVVGLHNRPGTAIRYHPHSPTGPRCNRMGWGSANVSRATAVWRAYGGSWTNTRLEVRRSDRSGLVPVAGHPVGNPVDGPMLEPAIGRVTQRGGRPPGAVTADRGYGQAQVERDLTELGVGTVAIPRIGKPSEKRRQIESQDEFRDLVRWRTGAEGRISTLKRQHGWNRSRLTGIEGARIWCGHGVLAHNLTKLARLGT